MSSSTLPRKLWEHPNPQSTQMWAFKKTLEEQKGLDFPVRILLYRIYRRILIALDL